MKFRRERKRRPRAGLDLTPLVDIVFLLMLFFMLSSTFVVQSSIQVEMPRAEGAPELEWKDISVTLAHGDGGPSGLGPVFVDNTEVASMEELSRLLSERVVRDPAAMLLIRPDTRIDAGRLIEVMGIANGVGFTNMSVEARPPEREP